MGSWFSKNEEVDVENNVTQIVASVSLDEQKEIFILLAIICVIKIIEFLYMIWKAYHKQLKKKITTNFVNQA
jgi:hypothetical protein